MFQAFRQEEVMKNYWRKLGLVVYLSCLSRNLSILALFLRLQIFLSWQVFLKCFSELYFVTSYSKTLLQPKKWERHFMTLTIIVCDLDLHGLGAHWLLKDMYSVIMSKNILITWTAAAGMLQVFSLSIKLACWMKNWAFIMLRYKYK